MYTEIVPSDDLAWGGYFIVNSSAGPGGSINPSGSFSVPAGSEVTFTLTPDPGYAVKSLQVNGVVVSRKQTYTLTVYQDSEVVATFAPLPVISASAGDHGTIIPKGDIIVPLYSDAMFWIIPEPNYRIQEVTVDGETIGAVGFYVFEGVTTDHTIHAEFTVGAGTHTITATAGTHGYIVPSGVIEVTDGQSISFDIWPDGGYHIDYVLVDGVSVGACSTYTFTNVTSDHTIHVEFAEEGTYTITATAGTHGVIIPSGVVTVKANSNISFSIAPDEDYCISNIVVDGVSVGAAQAYNFVNITSDHTIHAEFALCVPGETVIEDLRVYPGNLVRWATGQLWCVAVHEQDDRTPKLILATSTDNGHSWTHVPLSAAIEGEQFRPDIAIDSQGTLHLVWENRGSGANPEYSNIQYISRTLSGEWSTLEWLSSELFDQDHPHIAVDANDAVHVIWTGKTTDYPDKKVIQHRVLVGGTWSTTEVIYHDDTYDGLTPDLAISGLTVLATWVAGIDNQRVLYARKYTDSWGEATQITGKGYAYDPDVMYDADGTTVSIVCIDSETSTYHVYESLNLNPLVRVDAPVADEYTNAWPSLSIGISYGCHIFWAGKGWGAHPDSYNIIHGIDGVTAPITNDMYSSYGPNPLCKDAPVVNSARVDRPLQGFALVWVYDQTELRYYQSPDLRWEHPVGYYEIIATSEGGGDVIPPGASYVAEGGSLTYSIVPHPHHKIDDVQVDNTSIGITTHYTFAGVTQDHTIHTKFSPIYHTILATAGEHGSINPMTVLLTGMVIGSYGTGNDQFKYPRDIACDDTYIYVADESNHRIVKRLKSDLSYVSQIGTQGSGNDQFNAPRGIACDDTYIYITDTYNQRVVKRLKSDLSYVSQVGSYGSGNDQFADPEGIACDDTYIYITDTYNHRVVKRLKSDLSFVAAIGSSGSGDDQFYEPRGIACDDTYIYITDYGNCRVVKRLKSDLSYVSQVGSYGSGNDQFGNPKGIACDDTYIYITDTGNNRVVIRKKSDLSYVSQITSYDDDKQFDSPQGVACDDLYLYIDDTNNCCVVKEPKSDEPISEVKVIDGACISFDIIPDEGYQIDYLLVDGETIAPTPTYMFTNVTSDHTIHAEFTEGGPYIITATAGTHGVIIPSGTVTVAANASTSFQMVPEFGYCVSQVLVDGNDVEPTLNYAFHNVLANHTIHVNFDKGTLPIPIVIDKDAAFGRFYSARSSSGVLWVTYTKRVDNVNQIFVAQSYDRGATWSVEAITDSSYDQTDPVMVIDSNDIVYVVWRGKGWGNNPDKFNLVCRRNVRGVWEDAVSITDIPHNQWDPNISLDGDDRVFVVWSGKGYGTHSTTSNIYMITYSEGSWSDVELVTDVSHFQDNPQITVDPNGNVYVMWSGYGWGAYPNDLNVKLRIKNKDTGWGSVLNVTDDEGYWFGSSVASDLTGTVHLAWYGGSSDFNIYYRTYSKTSGLSSVETITSKEPGAPQVDPTLGVDADNKVYLFWTGLGWPACDFVYNLRSKVKLGGTWSDFLTTDLMSNQRKPHLLSNVFPVVRNAKTNFPKTGLFITWYGSLNGYNGATWDEPELELDHLHIQDASTRKPKPVTGITEIDEEYVQTVALQFYPLRYLLKGANLSTGQKSEFITTTRMNYGLITLAFSDAGASASIRLVRRDQSGVESYSDLITISALNITSGGKYKGVERVEKLYGAHSIAVYVESITSGTVDVWLAAA